MWLTCRFCDKQGEHLCVFFYLPPPPSPVAPVREAPLVERSIPRASGRRAGRPRKGLREDYRAVLFERQRGRCGICEHPGDYFGMNFDHKYPQSRGGRFVLGNLQLTHPECNRAKADSVDITWGVGRGTVELAWEAFGPAPSQVFVAAAA